MEMSKAELRQLMKETILETLTTLGVSVDDPIQMQADFQHLREWRTMTDSLKTKGFLTGMGLALAGVFSLVWLGLKEVLSR